MRYCGQYGGDFFEFHKNLFTMNVNLSATENLAFSTVRIVGNTADGQCATGTGFFFLLLKKDNTSVPVIITNKHVVTNMVKGGFVLTTADGDGNPTYTNHFAVQFDDFGRRWRYHPDPDVDLCAIPIAQILRVAEERKQALFFRMLDAKLFPTEKQRQDFDLLEEILMIGYPNGIWDASNNMPIFRRGTTATHPNLNYNGKREFLIDVACFPGSSGSPVLIYNASSYTTKTGKMVLGGGRVILLGILYAGPQHTATGEIQIVKVPNLHQPVAVSRIPNNLGIVIKSERILELEQLFE